MQLVSVYIRGVLIGVLPVLVRSVPDGFFLPVPVPFFWRLVFPATKPIDFPLLLAELQ